MPIHPIVVRKEIKSWSNRKVRAFIRKHRKPPPINLDEKTAKEMAELIQHFDLDPPDGRVRSDALIKKVKTFIDSALDEGTSVEETESADPKPKASRKGKGDKLSVALREAYDSDGERGIKDFAREWLTAGEVKERFARAPNVGQARMVIGNRIRGIIRNKIKRGESSKKERNLIDTD